MMMKNNNQKFKIIKKYIVKYKGISRTYKLDREINNDYSINFSDYLNCCTIIPKNKLPESIEYNKTKTFYNENDIIKDHTEIDLDQNILTITKFNFESVSNIITKDIIPPTVYNKLSKKERKRIHNQRRLKIVNERQLKNNESPFLSFEEYAKFRMNQEMKPTKMIDEKETIKTDYCYIM